jgi:ssDNA-binding Zn-finger/Zn-ribbon topoisomerase 1
MCFKRCANCKKILIRKKDRKFGGFEVRTVNGKKINVRYCPACGVRQVTKVMEKEATDYKWRTRRRI